MLLMVLDGTFHKTYDRELPGNVARNKNKARYISDS